MVKERNLPTVLSAETKCTIVSHTVALMKYTKQNQEVFITNKDFANQNWYKELMGNVENITVNKIYSFDYVKGSAPTHKKQKHTHL